MLEMQILLSFSFFYMYSTQLEKQDIVDRFELLLREENLGLLQKYGEIPLAACLCDWTLNCQTTYTNH